MYRRPTSVQVSLGHHARKVLLIQSHEGEVEVEVEVLGDWIPKCSESSGRPSRNISINMTPQLYYHLGPISQ